MFPVISAPSALNTASRACVGDSGSDSSRRSARAIHPPPIEPVLASEGLIGEAHRHARGVAGLAGIGVARKRTFQRLGCRFGLPRPPLGRAKQLEVAWGEAAVLVRGGEHVDRLRPGVAVHGVATQLDCLDHRARYLLTLGRVLGRPVCTVNPGCHPSLDVENWRRAPFLG